MKVKKIPGKFPCACCQYYTQKQYESDMKKIAITLKGINFDGVWAPPRGGLTPAVKLSHLLDLPFLKKPAKRSLIFDDIADTGKCLEKYAKKGYFIATIFYHRQSSFAPKMWLREKKDKYIVFHWEKWQCAKKGVQC